MAEPPRPPVVDWRKRWLLFIFNIGIPLPLPPPPPPLPIWAIVLCMFLPMFRCAINETGIINVATVGWRATLFRGTSGNDVNAAKRSFCSRSFLCCSNIAVDNCLLPGPGYKRDEAPITRFELSMPVDERRCWSVVPLLYASPLFIIPNNFALFSSLSAFLFCTSANLDWCVLDERCNDVWREATLKCFKFKKIVRKKNIRNVGKI